MTIVAETYAARCRAGTLIADPAQEVAVEEFDRILAGLAARKTRSWFRKAPPPPRGLYLWGGVGRGKSMLMDLFVDVASNDFAIRRVHFHAFMQEIHAGMQKARMAGIEDALAPALDAACSGLDCFAFDEMQITDITDAMIVGRIFEALFAAGVVVVTTSNRPPDDLYLHGLNRQLFLPFIDILKEHMVVREMVSDTDHRQRKLEGERRYFTPLNNASRQHFDTLWQRLGDGAAPLNIAVKGRQVRIPLFANAVGRASFFDLCGQPLGPGDYIAIAGKLKLLFIEDIPLLSRNNFNEAKRFITLIDALYEAKAGVVCTAAARPELLYVEGTGAFEFERTTSRLAEMTAPDWPAPGVL